MNPKTPALSLTGGCSCDAIRYEIALFPLLLSTCNKPAAGAECHEMQPADFGRWRPKWRAAAGVFAQKSSILQEPPGTTGIYHRFRGSYEFS